MASNTSKEEATRSLPSASGVININYPRRPPGRMILETPGRRGTFKAESRAVGWVFLHDVIFDCRQL